jgi:hypothetical protein
LSVRTPGVWEIRQETPFLPDEPGKADQKIDFSWGHSAFHSLYHSPTESKGPPRHPSSSLAPTDSEALFVRLMPIGRPQGLPLPNHGGGVRRTWVGATT